MVLLVVESEVSEWNSNDRERESSLLRLCAASLRRGPSSISLPALIRFIGGHGREGE